MLRFVSPLAVLLSVGVLCVSSVRAATQQPPNLLVLSASEVPKNLHPTEARFIPNTAMAPRLGVTVQQLKSHGRITGYETAWEAPLSVKRGVTFIDDFVHAYRTRAGAVWDWGQLSRRDATTGIVVASSRPPIGEAHSVYKTVVAVKGKPVQYYAMVFHRGNYDASVVVAGFRNQIHLSDLQHYAEIVDRHLRGK